MQKKGAEELRIYTPTQAEIDAINRNEVYIVLDNVLDTYNIGAIFRLADATACKKIYICGESETPPNSRIQKASVGTWQWTPWEQVETAVGAIENLKQKNANMTVVSVELSEKSISYDSYDYPIPLALVVGHESEGVSKEVLEISDTIVQLPQLGINKSLNVMVSLGIVLYEVLEKNGIK